MNNTNEITVTLRMDRNHRPVRASFQHENLTGSFTAYRSCYEVRTDAVDFHGQWTTEPEARRFAASVGRAKAVKVASYYYVHGFGKVVA